MSLFFSLLAKGGLYSFVNQHGKGANPFGKTQNLVVGGHDSCCISGTKNYFLNSIGTILLNGFAKLCQTFWYVITKKMFRVIVWII